MAYGRFIGELKKGIEGEIVAYESSAGHDGCVIHLKTVGHTIFIPRQLIEELIARSVREGNSFGFDLAIENPAGEWVSLHVKSDPVRDEYSDAAYILHFRLKDD